MALSVTADSNSTLLTVLNPFSAGLACDTQQIVDLCGLPPSATCVCICVWYIVVTVVIHANGDLPV